MEIPSGGIGFFDSGVGGLTVLSACLEKLSASGVFRPVLYYGDNARAPYGGREEGEIAAFAEEAFSLFDDLRVSAAVIACNTVTAVCAERLRRKYPFPVVGAEPAVRPAARAGGEIFVLVTPATAKSARLLSLCARSEGEFPSARLRIFPCPGLAGAVEEYISSDTPVPLSSLLPPGSPSAVVLGCTHYVFLKKEIAAFYGCPAFDGNDGIARELCRAIGFSRKPPPPTTAARFFGVAPTTADPAPANSTCNSLSKNKRSRFFSKTGQKGDKKRGFSEIFFLGSGKNLNKRAYEQMFFRQNRAVGGQSGAKIPKK